SELLSGNESIGVTGSGQDTQTIAKMMSILEREINSAADHGEVVLWPIDDAPADIILPADVASETILKAKAKMADYFCLTVEMMTLCVDGRKFVRQTRNRLRRHGIAFAAAEDCTNSRPTVRGKATAWNRVA